MTALPAAVSVRNDSGGRAMLDRSVLRPITDRYAPLRRRRLSVAVVSAVVATLVAAGCAGSSHRASGGPAPGSPTAARHDAPPGARTATSHATAALHVLSSRRLPAPVQLPALGRLPDGT